jgi:mRNA interferase RelE/StbE
VTVIFLEGFEKETSIINNKKLALSVQLVITSIESATQLASVPNVKKLKGHKTAYRIRIGNYRIGFYYLNGVATLAAFGDRKDIYRKFP